jgi:hypothetical protein
MSNTIIKLKRSGTSESSPSSLEFGELALNYADGKLFYKAANGTILQFESGGGSGSDSFGTVNANGTLIVADTPGDILTLVAGDGISINGDAINDTITISSVSGGSPSQSNATSETFIADGVQNTFTLTTTVSDINNLIVTLDGLVQIPETHYTISSSDISFSEIPISNTTIEIRNITGVVSGGGSGGTGTSIETEIVNETTQTAVKDKRYVIANTSATTLTLPATPTLGDTLYVLVANDLANNIVARNGSKIMGVEEDLTLDVENISLGLVYVNSTLGWRII